MAIIFSEHEKNSRTSILLLLFLCCAPVIKTLQTDIPPLSGLCRNHLWLYPTTASPSTRMLKAIATYDCTIEGCDYTIEAYDCTIEAYDWKSSCRNGNSWASHKNILFSCKYTTFFRLLQIFYKVKNEEWKVKNLYYLPSCGWILRFFTFHSSLQALALAIISNRRRDGLPNHP